MCRAPFSAANRVLVPVELRGRRPWARLAFEGMKHDTRPHEAREADSGRGVETREQEHARVPVALQTRRGANTAVLRKPWRVEPAFRIISRDRDVVGKYL